MERNDLMQAGDILVTKHTEAFGLTKVLRITDSGDGTQVAHVLLYQRLSRRPALADVASAQVLAWHAPIACEGLARDSEIIGNLPVEPGELKGYLEYLKQTNFAAYAQEQGISVDEVIAKAQAAYNAGNALCDQKKFAEAIEKFDEAITEFPLFYVAHDNRAFALMDLGRLREAAAGFSESLRFEPNNPAALFSLGECHLKLGEGAEAAKIFRECGDRWPDHPHLREFLARTEALIGPRTEPAKPWWRVW
jgi:tetratricopeptide (TPR) repeat protein